MADLLSSKVAVQEEEPRVRSVQGAPTSILGAVGITERGPHERTLVTSFDQFVEKFGGFIQNGDLALAMQGFFDNGGRAAWVKRVVHYTDLGDAATKTSAAAAYTLQTASTASSQGTVLGTAAAPFDLEPGDTLDVDVDGGGVTTATFNATAGTVTAGNTETYALSDGETLTVAIDGGTVQTIEFLAAEFADIGAATAAEVAAVINAKLVGGSADTSGGAPRITSDTRGTDSGVDVTGGTANTALGFATGNNAGTGNVGDIDLVTVAEVKSVVEGAVAGVTVTDVSGQVQIASDTAGAGSSIQVAASSTADDELGFDNATHTGDDGSPQDTVKVEGKTDGTYGNELKVKVTAPTSGKLSEFNLQIVRDGLVVESFPNVSIDPTDDNYVEKVVNDEDTGSVLVKVTDQDATNVDPRPANGTFGPLSGGDDGLSGLTDSDFIGQVGGATGFRGLDDVDVQILICPDRATSAVHNGMITYCQDTRGMAIFPILDPPAGKDTAGINAYVLNTASLFNVSEFGAIYWPRVKVLNPRPAVYGDDENLVAPPSGHVAGTYARTDAEVTGGVYRAPAGVDVGRLRSVVGLETDEPNAEPNRDLVYPNRINPIRTGRGLPIFLDGARTLKGNGNFPTIPERRGVIFIEQSLKAGMEPFRFAPNTEETRQAAARTTTGFLVLQMKQGAFATKNPDTAFFVDFGEGVNPPSVVFAGKMVGRIGLATAKPAEFIVLRFSQDTRALEEEIA